MNALFAPILCLLAQPVSAAAPQDSVALALDQAPARYFIGRIDALRFDGEPPSFTGSVWCDPRQHGAVTPYVTAEGASEAHLGAPPLEGWRLVRERLAESRVAFTLEGEGPWRGQLFLPKDDGTKLEEHAFTIAVEDAWAVRTDRFDEVVERAAAWRLERGLPGAAWWRHRAGEAGASSDGQQDARSDGFGRSFALLSGGRALSENLRLDDLLSIGEGNLPSIPISELEGIEAPALEWSKLELAAEDALDPLARWIPADHHAVFLPSFDALVKVVDELRANGTPALDALEPRAEDARTQEFYQDQLCLELDAVARAMGGRVVRTVAMTGGDPYLRTGTDLALVYDCSQPEVFEAFALARVEARAKALGVEVELVSARGDSKSDGEGAVLRGAETLDRTLSSWILRHGDTVVVSNSRALVRRMFRTFEAPAQSLFSLEEYRWFRGRYPRGTEHEAAFVVVPDGAIRRWCGPLWRIASARRVQSGALLAEARAARTAQQLGLEPEGALAMAAPVPDFGALVADDAGGVRSTHYGTARFLTPIAELELDYVTEAEREGYVSWRRRYDALWGAAFDPIGAQVLLREDGLELDLSVRPIALRTDYRELLDAAGNERLAPNAGDLHTGTLAHFVIALDHDGRTMRQLEDLLEDVIPALDRPLSWVGDHAALWVDADPELVDEVQDLEDPEEFFEEHGWELPIGVLVDVDDPLRLTGFLGGVKALLESAAPGVMTWETRTDEDSGRSYVAIEPQDSGGWTGTPSLYYGVVPGRFVASLREEVVLRALARAGDEPSDAQREWVGQSVAAQLDQGLAEWLELGLVEKPLRAALQRRAWSALPILNEWRRLYPDEDPVEVQARLFGATVRCPGGGRFVWNENVGSMESTVYGCPAAPKDGPGLPAELKDLRFLDLGVTFEELVETWRNRPLNGLRANVSLGR